MSVELISVLSFLCGIAVGWLLLRSFIFSSKDKAGGVVLSNGALHVEMDYAPEEDTLKIYGGVRRALVTNIKSIGYDSLGRLLAVELCFDVDWFIAGDVIRLESSNLTLKVYQVKGRDANHYVYLLCPISPEARVQPIVGERASRVHNSGYYELDEKRNVANKATIKSGTAGYSHKDYGQNDYKSSFSSSSDSSVVTNLLLNPLSTISVWNNSDDNVSSSTYDSGSYDSGGSDCGGGGD